MATKAKPKTAPAAPTKWGDLTAEDLERERDTEGKSWVAVAQALGLSSPTQARTAYTELTGLPHYESRMPEGSKARAPRNTTPRARKKAASLNPGWNDDSDQDEIIAALDGRFILVARSGGHTEEVAVSRVTEFEYSGKDGSLCVHLLSAYNGAARCFRVRDILEVANTPRRKKKAKEGDTEDTEDTEEDV